MAPHPLPDGGSGEPAGAGLYLHIPFCSAICPYCDFAVLTGGRERRAHFVQTLAAEIALWTIHRTSGHTAPDSHTGLDSHTDPVGRATPDSHSGWGTFDTIYLGGGTPSALEPDDIGRLLASLKEALPVAPDVWIAFEVNPEDVTEDRVRQWRSLGVSMLSLGVQSFDAATLRFLGRRHTPAQARGAVELALAAGFPTVSLDLIYGNPDPFHSSQEPAHDHPGPLRRSPGALRSPTEASDLRREPRRSEGSPPVGGTLSELDLTAERRPTVEEGLARWRRDLEQAVALSPDHLSCYQLTIHEGTPFGFRAARGELAELPEPDQADLFLFTHTFLAEHGYPGYEVSNFARSPEHRSRHNRKYWNHTPYLGLGPSAHSFDGRKRWWNERKLPGYEALVAGGQRPIAGSENLAPVDLALEELMLALRTTDGLDLTGFHRRHHIDLAAANRRLIEDLATRGLATERNGRLVPSLAGLAIADTLARAFDLPDDPNR